MFTHAFVGDLLQREFTEVGVVWYQTKRIGLQGLRPIYSLCVLLPLELTGPFHGLLYYISLRQEGCLVKLFTFGNPLRL